MKTSTIAVISLVLILYIKTFAQSGTTAYVIKDDSLKTLQTSKQKHFETKKSEELKFITNNGITGGEFLLFEYAHQYWDTTISNWKNIYSESNQYDSNNRLVEKITQTFDEYEHKVNYSYNTNNLLDVELIYDWENIWELSSRRLHSYDSLFNLIEKLHQYLNDTTWFNASRTNYTYDPNNNLIEELEEVWTGIYWFEESRDVYTYDINMNVTEWLHQWRGDNDWLVAYTYDVDNKLIEELWMDWERNDSEWINQLLITFSYDNQYNLIEALYKTWNDSVWINSALKKYVYDINNYLDLEEIYFWQDSTWIFDYRFLYIYDAHYNLITKTQEYWDGTNYIAFLRDIYSYLPTGVEEVSSFVIKYVLSQNYPNPFNPSTRISWQLPIGSWHSLKIYDVLGNEVATLVDEYKPAGTYEIEWDAKGLPSGVYFYQLKTESFIQTRKMILLR